MVTFDFLTLLGVLVPEVQFSVQGNNLGIPLENCRPPRYMNLPFLLLTQSHEGK